MNHLYIVTRHNKGGYDTYESFLVCCASEQEARETHPAGMDNWIGRHTAWIEGNEIHLLKVQCIGVANKDTESGVLMSVFYPG